MKLRSLATRTDLEFIRFGGRVDDRGEYLVAESLDNPDYYWGNLLLFSGPPQPGDGKRWLELFQKEFLHQPRVRHVTLAWDGTDGARGAAAEFTGFTFEEAVILTATAADLRSPAKWNGDVTIRPLRSSEDWEAATNNQIIVNEDIPAHEFIPFKRAQMTKYRRMVEHGFGEWWGAFLGQRLVADCGLYVFGDVGRYQSVVTDPDFRRQGICGTLIHASGEHALARGAKSLVMAADPEYHAARIYESVGFQPRERQVGLCRSPERG